MGRCHVLTSGIVFLRSAGDRAEGFQIQDGSFVNGLGIWLIRPEYNGSETISASVTDDSQKSRLVTFNAMIKISNTLEKLDITFDLAAEGYNDTEPIGSDDSRAFKRRR